MGLLLLMGDSQPNVRSLFGNNEPGLALDIGDRYGASEAKRTWRRNLLGYSNTPSNTGWLKFYATATENAGTSPFGGSDAFKIVEDSTTNFHYIQTPSITLESGRTYTYSVYAKAAERSVFYLDDAVSPFAGSVKAVYDLASGTVSSSQDCTPFIEDAGNGWYRCGWTATADTSGSARMQIVIGDNSYLGDGASGVLFYGSQLEAGSLTEYQPITDFSTEFKQAYPTHSLYQDSNGVTPAVYPNDPVGLVIDSGRGGLANLGPELVGNGTFDSDTTGWSAADANAAIEVASGRLKVTTISGSTGGRQAFSSVAGRFYRVTGEMEVESGTFGVRIDSPLGTVMYSSATHTSASGLVSFSFIVSAASTQFVVYLRASTAGVAYFDNISVREIPGVHGYQTSSGSRPLLCRTPFSGRRNLLVRSEELVEGVGWTAASTTTTVTQNAIANPLNGQVTADNVDITDVSASRFQQTSLPLLASTQYTISGYFKNNTMTTGQTFDFRLSNFLAGPNDCIAAARINLFDGSVTDVSSGSGISGTSVAMVALGDGWYRVSVTFTSGSGAATSSAGVQLIRSSNAANFYAFGFQYELGASATAYQKVVTTTDVTEAGKADCWGLLADGVDDWLATPSISFNTWTQDTRRNLLVDTESFGSSTWTKSGSSVTENSIAAPDGTTTADTLTEDSSAARHWMTVASSAVANQVATFSIYVKKKDRRYCFITLNNSGGVSRYSPIFDLDNGTVVAENVTGSPASNSASITSAGSGWYRLQATLSSGASGLSEIGFGLSDSATPSLVVSSPTYTGDGTSGIYIWGAQVEIASSATDYQRVGTDKMTVMAGVRKQQSALVGMIAELSASSSSNSGAFWLLDGNKSASAGDFISFRSNGTLYSGVVDSPVTSGSWAVVSGISTISADLAEIRLNGVSDEISSGDQGSGNYGNYPLYIGRRGGSTLPFSGILYTLIIRGAATPTGTIANFERNLLAKRAGVSF